MLRQAALTPFAKQSLNEMQPKYLIEVFQEQELQVNITKHVLVPKHQARSKHRQPCTPASFRTPAIALGRCIC
jgi:DNA-directed RNA polymerase I, II, and III subunit RPABC1